MVHRLGVVRALAAVCLLVWAGAAEAHKLTGTDLATVAALAVDERLVGGTYEVQYGELAAFDQRQRMDADRDGRLSAGEVRTYVDRMASELVAQLVLEIDGTALAVHLEAGQVLPADSLVAPGQMTLRYTVRSEPSDFARPRQLRFRDGNQMPRLVHSDISVEGMPLVDLDPAGIDPGAGFVKQVRVQAVQAPVEARVLLKPSESVWQSGPQAAALAQPPDQAAATKEAGTDRLKDVLRAEQLGPGLVLFALALALFLGGVHALEPGHGKTIVAAYLVGSRGTVAHAAFLGAVVTLTHTFSVILLGLITLFASQYILPERILPWLGFGSGLLIATVGVWLFVRALTRGDDRGHRHGLFAHRHAPPVGEHGRTEDPSDGHVHGHADDHDHEHGHPHEHPHDDESRHEHGHAHPHPHDRGHGHGQIPAGPVSIGSLLALGVSGGLVPCPGALVILLLAVALHRIAFGMVLILAFSLGLAAVLVVIGVLMVKAQPLMDRFSGEGRWTRRLPVISSVVITAVGLAMGARSLIEAGIVIIRW